MRNIKRIKSALLAIAILCALALTACGGDTEETLPATTTYTVEVVDPQGNPYTSGVIARFMSNGQQVAMQVVDANGVATKELATGDYTVELQFTSESSCWYDAAGAVVSYDKPELQIVLINGVSGETRQINGYSILNNASADHAAYILCEGYTYVELTAGERNYFIFTPTQAGTYQFSTVSGDAGIGCYGSSFFVQDNSIAEVVDNTFTISVSGSMIGTDTTGTSNYVIGLDATGTLDYAIVRIERIGDPEETIADKPWTEYETTVEINPFTLNADAADLAYVDITGKTGDFNFLYNENDGYYHLNDVNGPVIYVHLGSDAPYVSLQVIIMGDGGLSGGAPIRHYFFDENGDFIKKEDYTDILITYFENMDQTAQVYPLTADLIYIIQNGCCGWWDVTSPDYIFEGCNPEIGWMFACCYIPAG